MCPSQNEHCGAAPNHVQTPAPAALQHHPLLPPHLPHLGAALCVVGGLAQGARPAEVGVCRNKSAPPKRYNTGTSKVQCAVQSQKNWRH